MLDFHFDQRFGGFTTILVCVAPGARFRDRTAHPVETFGKPETDGGGTLYMPIDVRKADPATLQRRRCA